MEVIPKEGRREREIRMQNITGQKIEEEESMGEWKSLREEIEFRHCRDIDGAKKWRTPIGLDMKCEKEWEKFHDFCRHD